MRKEASGAKRTCAKQLEAHAARRREKILNPQQAEQRKRRGGGEARKLRGRVGQPRVGRKGVDTRELRKACNECSGHLVWHAERAQVVHGRARHAVGVGVVQRGVVVLLDCRDRQAQLFRN